MVLGMMLLSLPDSVLLYLYQPPALLLLNPDEENSTYFYSYSFYPLLNTIGTAYIINARLMTSALNL